MDLDSVREVKAAAKAQILVPLVRTDSRRLGVRAQSIDRISEPDTIALGIARSSAQGYVLAVRIQHPALRTSSAVENLRQIAKGEVNVQYIGAARKRQVPWYQQRCRPLRIGCSVGHVQVTAGTLGAFARSREDNSSMALSNNHVFADENAGNIGDGILQPGKFDGGQDPADKMGTLAKFVPLDFQNINYFDCATARIDPAIQFDSKSLDTAGNLSTAIPAAVQGGEAVMKLGRTTGLTQGRITAIELDNVAVGYDNGQAHFNQQIEIEGAGDFAFSQGGDSGSLVFDQNLAPVALLFAGTDQGGTNNMGFTYANPLRGVLDALAVDLLT
jgi:hypothetical protein